MDLPQKLLDYLRREYPRPTVDLDWLKECYQYILDDAQLNPAISIDAIIQEVDFQFLRSNLRDSTMPGTGFPANVQVLDGVLMPGPPVLVEITAIEEVGHSAFSLLNVAEARTEYAKREAKKLAAGMNDPDDDADDEQDDIKLSYPHSMLRFELSDGSRTLEAFEYSRLPDIELGETPIGYKMVISKVFIRGGRAFLEPANIKLKGGFTGSPEDASTQEDNFVRSFKRRMGLPVDDAPAPPLHAPPPAIPVINPHPPRAPPPAPPPATLIWAHTTPGHNSVRSPLREISEPPEPGPSGSRSHDDDERQSRKRKVPVRIRTRSPLVPPRPRSTHSRYFSDVSDTSPDKGNKKAGDLARELMFSPHRNSPLLIADTDDELDTTEGASDTRQGKRKEITDTSRVHWDPAEHITDPGDVSSEYGFDDIPDEVMAELNRVEEELTHVAGSVRSQPTQQSQVPTQMQTTLVGSGRSVVTSSQATLVGGNSRDNGPPQRAHSQRRAPPPPQATDFIIEVEDDEDDEDEKENIAAPTRHIRRRIQPDDDDDVIVISD